MNTTTDNAQEQTKGLRELIEAAKCVGHYETLRDSSDETIAYWNQRVNELSEQFAAPAAPATPESAEPVAWFPTSERGDLVRNYGDGSAVYASVTKESAEQVKRNHLGARGPVVPLYLRPTPAASDGDMPANAKHWHDLYRTECRTRQDDAARYGQQIAEMEAASDGGLREALRRIEVALGSLEADSGYLMGRVAADGSCAAAMAEAVRQRVQTIREQAAIIATPQASTPAAVAPEPMALARVSGNVRAALLFALWHHQGGSSPVGQTVRRILGMGEHARLNDDQAAAAKRMQDALLVGRAVAPEQVTEEDIEAMRTGFPFVEPSEDELRAAGNALPALRAAQQKGGGQ